MPPEVQLTTVTLAPNLTVHCPGGGVAEARYIYNEIYRDACYAAHGLALEPGATVVDVGANIGLFTRFMTDRFASLRVFCFEPSPPTYACLEKNLESISGHEIHPRNVALAEAPGTLTLSFMPHAPGNSTSDPKAKIDQVDSLAEGFTMQDVWNTDKLYFFALLLLFPIRRWLMRKMLTRAYSGAIPYECEASTLDRLFETEQLDKVALLKIDVEGAEMAVLDGLSDDNLRRVDQVILELSPNLKHHVPRLLERFAGCGLTEHHVDSMVSGSNPNEDPYAANVFARRPPVSSSGPQAS